MRAVAQAVLQAPRQALVGLVRLYRLLLSPWIGQDCRFAPTCSHYAIEALQRHGAVGGSLYAAWRIARCNPLCAGGCDPVPDNPPWRRARPGAAPRAADSVRRPPTGLPASDPPAAAAAARDDLSFSKTPS